MTFFSGHEVSKANGGEGDDDKVDGLERAPAFDMFENDSWQGHEDEAPEQDEEQGGDDADLCLADFPLLIKRIRRRKLLRSFTLKHPRESDKVIDGLNILPEQERVSKMTPIELFCVVSSYLKMNLFLIGYICFTITHSHSHSLRLSRNKVLFYYILNPTLQS